MKTDSVKHIEDESIIINGFGNHVHWKTAELLTDFIAPWDLNFKPKVVFKALCDSKFLYFYFQVEDSEVYVNNLDDSIESIGTSDRVELFFRINNELNPYYCLEMDSSVRVMDFKVKPGKFFDFNINYLKDGLELKSNVSSKGYGVEGAITLELLKQLKLLKN